MSKAVHPPPNRGNSSVQAMRVSVVVPTFNRGPVLRETLKRLLATEMEAVDDLEIIVVDDGSCVPAREAVSSIGCDDLSSQTRLRWLRQANAGPAAARNAGFRAASGDVVLFVDDDILVPPSLVGAHVAAHRASPGAVIFGFCPFVPGPETPFRSFLDRGLVEQATSRGLVPMPIVASGQISVERGSFAPEEDVYASQLVTPGAEEYELAYRLREDGVPILGAPSIVALHDQNVDVASYCRAQYKHGVGCGEVAAKRPDLLAHDELASIIEASRPGRIGMNPIAVVKRAQKWLLSRRPPRAMLLGLARVLERMPMPAVLRYAAYRAAISSHFIAGVRDGLSLFASDTTL